MAATLPDIIDLCRSRGDTYADIFDIVDADDQPVDISGATFLLTVDPEPDPTDSLNNLFQLNGIIIDALSGVVGFVPTLVDMDQVPDPYFYDIQMTDSTGAVRTIAKGTFIILPDVTK